MIPQVDWGLLKNFSKQTLPQRPKEFNIEVRDKVVDKFETAFKMPMSV